MISPLTPRQAAELLLAASLRTGGMTQTEWLATLGGPGSGNFGHAGRPGEVGGSADGEGGASISSDKDTGSAPTPELAAQSAKGIAACQKLLDKVVAEAQYGSASGNTGDWSDVDASIRQEVENSLRDDIIERLQEEGGINTIELHAPFKEYLRTDDAEIEHLMQRAAEGVVAAGGIDPDGPGISMKMITDNVDTDADEGQSLDTSADLKFEDGTSLTDEQKEKLSELYDQAYAEAETEAFDQREDTAWWQEAVGDMEKEYVQDQMSQVDDIMMFDRAHAWGYDDSDLFNFNMDPGVPTEWHTGLKVDALQTPEDEDNYARTTAIVREMAYQRSAEIADERGIGHLSPAEIRSVWDDWKGSSQETTAKAFQQAAADELGGVSRFSANETAALRSRGDFEEMKAYVRGQWETNQWLLNKAGADYVDVYRAVMLPDLDNANVVSHEVPASSISVHVYDELPEISLQRNGAQSTTSDVGVANSWQGISGLHEPGSVRAVLRIRAPRTSVLSVPVFGDNEANEHETVLAGTRDRWWWDLWRRDAPEFNVYPPQQTAVHRAAAEELKPIVIDFFEIDKQYPQHWLSRKQKRLGGPGSGNFGHSGRPGEVGGSGEGSGGPVISGQGLRKQYAAKLADVAQKVYDDWDESNIDEFAGGGICHLIAEDIASELNTNGIEATTVSSEIGEQHVWVVAKLEDGVYNIDIPPGVYERGGGYTWSKIEGVRFSQEDIIIERIDGDPESFSNYTELRSAGGKGSGNFGHAGRPGEVGGSSSDGGGAEPDNVKLVEKADYALMGGDMSDLSRAERGQVKQDIVDAVSKRITRLAEERGVETDREEAKLTTQRLLDEWAHSSGDSNYKAIANQKLAAKEFGLEEPAMDHFPRNVAIDADKFIAENDGHNNDLTQMAMRAQYEETQTWFREQGIKEVILFRGASYKKPIDDGATELHLQPLSSFATSVESAVSFAAWADAGDRYIHSVRVPVEQVFSTSRTGVGCINEHEMVLLGGRHTGFTHSFRAAEDFADNNEREIPGLRDAWYRTIAEQRPFDISEHYHP